MPSKSNSDILIRNLLPDDYNMTKAAKTIGNTKQFISFLQKSSGLRNRARHKKERKSICIILLMV